MFVCVNGGCAHACMCVKVCSRYKYQIIDVKLLGYIVELLVFSSLCLNVDVEPFYLCSLSQSIPSHLLILQSKLHVQ